MDCPQCGGTLATYALSGREASVCEDCGYVGIAAEHRGEARRVESWDDALRRFYRAHDSDADPSVEVRPPLSRPSAGADGESWEDALRRFHARRANEADSEMDVDTDPGTDADVETETDAETGGDDDPSTTVAEDGDESEGAGGDAENDNVEADAGGR
jgi:DNA-directed RNA polymerase subunit M/transcription elongation factor TFIIS